MGNNLDTLENTIYINTIQKIMGYLLKYIIIGIILSIFIDYWTDKLKMNDAKFTNVERITLILLWPVLILMLIIDYITKNDKTNYN